MIYRSNLVAPDLQPYFKYAHCRPMPHSMGHDILSDFADRPADDPVFGLYKNCGFWTHDEAAILFNIAQQVGGAWLDIGCHTGWTSTHIAAAGCSVTCIDPMLRVQAFQERFEANMESLRGRVAESIYLTSNTWLSKLSGERRFSGVVIDGDHNHPCPLQDADNAVNHLADDGVILFHDFMGAPVIEGVNYLLGIGFKVRAYFTPHMIACCWRGNFQPPQHIRDPHIHWPSVQALMETFDFSRCS